MTTVTTKFHEEMCVSSLSCPNQSSPRERFLALKIKKKQLTTGDRGKGESLKRLMLSYLVTQLKPQGWMYSSDLGSEKRGYHLLLTVLCLKPTPWWICDLDPYPRIQFHMCQSIFNTRRLCLNFLARLSLVCSRQAFGFFSMQKNDSLVSACISQLWTHSSALLWSLLE